MPKSFLLHTKKKRMGVYHQEMAEPDNTATYSTDIIVPKTRDPNHPTIPFPVTSSFLNATTLRHSDSSPFNRIPCCFPPFPSALHDSKERVLPPYSYHPLFPHHGIQPCQNYHDHPSLCPSGFSFPVCSTLLSAPPVVKPEEHPEGSRENVWTNVDPRIPFTTYFLNLTRLLSESRKKSEILSPEIDKSFSSEGSTSSADHFPNNNSSCNQNKLFNRHDDDNHYEKGLKPIVTPLPEIPPSLIEETSRTSAEYSKLFTPHTMAGNLNPALFHPAFMQLNGLNMRRPITTSEKPAPIKKYKCDICGKGFSRSNTLVTHKRIHTGDKPFKCEVCDRAFRQPGNLTRHRLTHTTVKPYVCVTCSKAFNRASNLHTHMRTHTNYKPFICTYCGKGFHQKIDMKIHCYTHTGERPHSCDICGKSFTLASTLNTHRRTHVSKNSTYSQSKRHADDQLNTTDPHDNRGENSTISSKLLNCY